MPHPASLAIYVCILVTLLNLATWNIHGIKHGTTELCDKLYISDVVLLTEHWLERGNSQFLETFQL